MTIETTGEYLIRLRSDYPNEYVHIIENGQVIWEQLTNEGCEAHIVFQLSEGSVISANYGDIVSITKLPLVKDTSA